MIRQWLAKERLFRTERLRGHSASPFGRPPPPLPVGFPQPLELRPGDSRLHTNPR